MSKQTNTSKRTVEIRECEGVYQVWQDVFEGKQQVGYWKKVKSSRDLSKMKRFALTLAPVVGFGQQDFYNS